MYKIIDWDTGQVLQEHTSLATAKRECRKLGCSSTRGCGFEPVAFVSDGTQVFGRWCCIYNPRFRTASQEQIKGVR